MKRSDSFLDQLPVEAQFIVALVRCHAHQQQQKPLLPEAIDWKLFVELAYATHLAGIIFDSVMENGTGKVPSEVIQQLKSYPLRVTTANERFLHQYQLLVSLADQHALLLYPLKGITLMPHVYAQRYHRHISDIDVFVSKYELNTWEDLLKKNGFRTKRRFAKSTFHEQIFDKYDPLQAFKQEIIIDFHVSLNCGLFDVQLPLERLQAHQANAHELSRLDQLIFVCLHAYKHFYYGQLKMIHLMDIHHLLADISNEELTQRCIEFRCLSKVMEAITICDAFLGKEHRPLKPWERSVLQVSMSSGTYTRRHQILFYLRRHFSMHVKPIQLLPYLWYQLFPSAAYLEQSTGKKGYLRNWGSRLIRLITR